MIPIAFHSWFGAALAVLYLVAASAFVWSEVHSVQGGFISLRGMGAVIATSPSQATLGVLLRKLGVRPIDYSSPGLGGTIQLIAHLLLSAIVVFCIGAGLEYLVRFIASRV
ncbi:MAG: hypothetical protein ABIT38_06585 [Gemmatimonadaceae bacterium]